jgi:DNA-binding transcriptional LysR family regulator
MELGITLPPFGEQIAGFEFELLRAYPLCVAVAAAHPFARLKSVPLTEVATQPLVVLSSKGTPDYSRYLEHIFSSIGAVPRIGVECDLESSLLVEVEAGRGIALAIPPFELVMGKRMACRPVTGTAFTVPVGIVRAVKGDVTTAGEQFCEALRKVAGSLRIPIPLGAKK